MQEGRECQGLAGGGMGISIPQRALGPGESPVPSFWVSLQSCLWHGEDAEAGPIALVLVSPLGGSLTGGERGIRERGQVSFEAQLIETWTIQTFLGLKGDSLRPGPPPPPPYRRPGTR